VRGIAAEHVQRHSGQAHRLGQLLHLQQRCPAVALPAMFRVDEELKDERHADAAAGQAAQPDEAEHRAGRIAPDLVEMMIGRGGPLRQMALELRSGERLGLLLGPAARGHVVRRMGGAHDVDELVEPLRRHGSRIVMRRLPGVGKVIG
jgi:hypothetical protein